MDKNEHVAVDEKEFEAAQTEALGSTGLYVHTFKKPFDYMGKKYKELTFDWESLTGRDSLDIEAEVEITTGRAVIVPAFSGEYLIRMAAKACAEPIGYDALEFMPLVDYNKIRSPARSFLLAAE